MTATKEQERKALEKIAAIIEELGQNSYLNMTFSGILEQAEENITNDFASNYRDMYQKAQHEKEQAIISMRKLEDRVSELEDVEELLHTEREATREYLNKLYAAQGERDAMREELNALNAEIVELKAKLYDLITK